MTSKTQPASVVLLLAVLAACDRPITCIASENGTTGATSWHTPAGFDCQPSTQQVESYLRVLRCDPNNDYATPGQIIPECKQ